MGSGFKKHLTDGIFICANLRDLRDKSAQYVSPQITQIYADLAYCLLCV